MALPDSIAELATHPLNERGAGLVLQCDDGELSVMRELFEVVSPFFGQLLSSTDERFVKVPGTTREQWLLIISQLYPLTPLPDLTSEQLGKVLPVAHKFNFPDLLQHLGTALGAKLAAGVPETRDWFNYVPHAMLVAQKYEVPGMQRKLLQGISRLPWAIQKDGITCAMMSCDFSKDFSKLTGLLIMDIMKAAKVQDRLLSIQRCSSCSEQRLQYCIQCKQYVALGKKETVQAMQQDKPWFADL